MGGRKLITSKRYLSRGPDVDCEPYQYRACGLDDVYLTSGFERADTGYGAGVKIEDVEGLHHAIGFSLITDPKPLSPPEFRFLRKNMGLTQQDLAKRLQVDPQTVARYEKEQTAIPGSVNMLIRIFFMFHITSPEKRAELMETLQRVVEAELSARGHKRNFEMTPHGWDETATHVGR
jgi:DNA-binding XRE family transcriptional regulator